VALILFLVNRVPVRFSVRGVEFGATASSGRSWTRTWNLEP
jgi:hypothetical protein